MLSDDQIKDLALRLLKHETERDKQRNVGASQISDPCTYHLAKALRREPEYPSKYWLGAKLGTATHLLIEDSIARADFEHFPEIEGALVEQKIHLGELEGYGSIDSKPDFAIVKHGNLIDWKTSTRDKMRKLQKAIDDPDNPKNAGSLYTLQKYIAQMQLYAWGLNAMGISIKRLSLVFINRDGTQDSDVWTHTFDYSEEFAVSVWNRLERLWTVLQDGAELDSLPRHQECYKCSIETTISGVSI